MAPCYSICWFSLSSRVFQSFRSYRRRIAGVGRMSKQSAETGFIVGLVLGVLILFSLLAFLIYFIHGRRLQQQQQQQQQQRREQVQPRQHQQRQRQVKPERPVVRIMSNRHPSLALQSAVSTRSFTLAETPVISTAFVFDFTRKNTPSLTPDRPVSQDELHLPEKETHIVQHRDLP